MQNLERSEFDEQWKNAFAEGEVTPSASVWANVDRDLTLADNAEGKRRIIFYQRLAAACVVFAVVAGAFGVYNWKRSETNIVRLNSSKTTDVNSHVNPKLTENNSSSPSQATGVDSLNEKRTDQVNSGKTADVASQSNPTASEKNGTPEVRAAIASNSLAKRRASEPTSKKKTESSSQPQSITLNEIQGSPQKQIAGATNILSENKATVLNAGMKSEETETKSSFDDKNAASQSQKAIAGSPSENKIDKGAAELSTKPSSEKTTEVVAEAKSMPNEKVLMDKSDASISQRANDESNSEYKWLAANVDLPGLELLPTAEISGEPKLTEIYRKLPYIPASFMNEKSNSKFEHEKLWASVTAASGSYTESTGSSYNSPAAMQMYSANIPKSTPPLTSISSNSTGAVPTVGKSYSYGVIGGVRLAERWVLQTGVQYMNQTMGSATSQYANYGSGGMISTNEFVSVPVQAGYLLVNRKIGWQLNPGVSTDFFVRNTLSNQQQSVSQGAGENSPYRSVNFAGLMSSEFSYKLGKNYRLSLVPGMRYSFNPALKATTTGSALAWDVGFRFRYIFK